MEQLNNISRRPLPPTEDGTERMEMYFPEIDEWYAYRKTPTGQWEPEEGLFGEPEKTKYGSQKLDYLQKHESKRYYELLRDGELNDYNLRFNAYAEERRQRFIDEYMRSRGVTPEKKNEDPILWFSEMDRAITAAEMYIRHELIYTSAY